MTIRATQIDVQEVHHLQDLVVRILLSLLDKVTDLIVTLKSMTGRIRLQMRTQSLK